MARTITMMLIVSVVVLLFHFSGLLSGNPSLNGYLLSNLGLTTPENIGTTSFWVTLLTISTISIAGAVISGLITRSLEFSLFVGVGVVIVPIFLGMIQDLILIYLKISETSPMLAVMIVSPLMVTWGLTIYDWVRGRD